MRRRPPQAPGARERPSRLLGEGRSPEARDGGGAPVPTGGRRRSAAPLRSPRPRARQPDARCQEVQGTPLDAGRRAEGELGGGRIGRGRGGVAGRGGSMKNPSRRPHAQMRQSQLVTTFGPGAMVDLPNHGVLIGGLESWTEDRRPIREERLVAKLEAALEIEGLELFAPPIDSGDWSGPPSGISAWEFPEWFVSQFEDADRTRQGFRSRPLVHREAVVRGRYFGPDKKKHAVVPIRFVQACLNGHLSDIDWYAFVHGPGDACRRRLWLDERGTSGDLADVLVRCECGKVRSLATATLGTGRDPAPLGFCRGERPWLRRP